MTYREVDPDLAYVESTRNAERDARSAYVAQWSLRHAVPHRVKVAEAIQVALDAGYSKRAILAALGTKNYKSITDYLELLSGSEVRILTVAPKAEVNHEAGTATVGAHHYTKDAEGRWEPEDMDSDAAWEAMKWLP